MKGGWRQSPFLYSLQYFKRIAVILNRIILDFVCAINSTAIGSFTLDHVSFHSLHSLSHFTCSGYLLPRHLICITDTLFLSQTSVRHNIYILILILTSFILKGIWLKYLLFSHNRFSSYLCYYIIINYIATALLMVITRVIKYSIM